MNVRAALMAGRRRAESLMVDRCVIERNVGTDIDDEGRETPTWASVYEGRCKVQTYEPYESERESARAHVVQQRYSVHVPVSAGPFRPGDRVTITAAAVAFHAVGAKYRVAGLHEKTFQTAQRLLVDEEV